MRKVVNITSVSGIDGNAGQAGYGAGKAGINGITKVMAKEWGRYNVNVNSVGFGFIETRLVQPLDAGRIDRNEGPENTRRRAAGDARSGESDVPSGPVRERWKRPRDRCCSSARRYRIM